MELVKIYRTKCTVCPHECLLAPWEYGLCNARRNVHATVKCINYGRVSAMSMKKGTQLGFSIYGKEKFLAVGSFGSNMNCDYYNIAQLSRGTDFNVDTRVIRASDMAEIVGSLKAEGCRGLAFTYNEPLIGFEYVRDCAKYVRRRGMKTLICTNGFIKSDSLHDTLEWCDAISVNLPGWSDDVYRKHGGTQVCVENFICSVSKEIHTEVSYYVMDEKSNDSDEVRLVSDMLHTLKTDIVLHLVRRGNVSDEKMCLLSRIAQNNMENVITE